MKQALHSQGTARSRTVSALSVRLSRERPDLCIDARGYAHRFQDTLLPGVLPDDFEADLSAGDGNELQTKFRAAHSSSGLAVNCFAPFRQRLTDLNVLIPAAFETLQFERKCHTGLRGGRAPNLDVLLYGPEAVVGIESKLTEYLSSHRAEFSSAYETQITDARREQGYFREMLRLVQRPDSYTWLDAAQLIKHAFGLARTFSDRPVTLLYLFWEPANPGVSREFAAHREEIAEFSARVAGSSPTFAALSYPELWQSWRENPAAAEWVVSHVINLRARYLVQLSSSDLRQTRPACRSGREAPHR